MKISKVLRVAAPVAVAAALLLSGCSATASGGAGGGNGATAAGSIVLSNSYIGNAWRQAMVDDAQTVAAQAKKDGVSSGLKVVNSNNDVADQISQLRSIILQHPKVIMLLAASPTALNGTITTACNAGIKVIAFDASVTAPCAYKMSPDWVKFGEQTMTSVAKKMNGKGNVILVHGVEGTDVDNGMYTGWKNALKSYPGIKVASEVDGNWDDATTQSAISGVLTTAPKIDGVMAYVSGYGATQAFQAAGRPIPIVYGSNQGTFLKWWAGERKSGDYSTESAMEGPAISEAAYWVAVQLANGKSLDKRLIYPTFTVTDDTVAEWAAKTPNDGFADQHWTQKAADAQWASK